MTTVDREQIKRDCADALEALNRDQRVDGIARLADTIRWHLIHVLEELEKGVE